MGPLDDEGARTRGRARGGGCLRRRQLAQGGGEGCQHDWCGVWEDDGRITRCGWMIAGRRLSRRKNGLRSAGAHHSPNSLCEPCDLPATPPPACPRRHRHRPRWRAQAVPPPPATAVGRRPQSRRPPPPRRRRRPQGAFAPSARRRPRAARRLPFLPPRSCARPLPPNRNVPRGWQWRTHRRQRRCGVGCCFSFFEGERVFFFAVCFFAAAAAACFIRVDIDRHRFLARVSLFNRVRVSVFVKKDWNK